VRALVLVLIAASAWADPDDAGGYALTLDGQLERISAELPCPLDDDTWKATPSRVPPDRPCCPFTAATEPHTRKLWRAAAENAKYLRLEDAQANPTRFAGRPYLVSGVVRVSEFDLLYRLRLTVETSRGARITVLVNQTFPMFRAGASVEGVGYLAEESGELALAAADLGAPGDVALLIEWWDRPMPPSVKARRRWFRK